MSGSGDKPPDSRTIAEIDGEIIDRYNKSLQATLEREARLHRHYEWKGSKLPPFSIEPQPYERQRLAGAGMTAEDRVLRRQWLKDQELAHNEPRYIPELYPRNPIRRILGKPWNVLFGALRPIVGERIAQAGRNSVPKFLLALVAFYGIYYQLKFNPSRWSDKRGWHMYSSKPTLMLDNSSAPEMQDTDFFDKGFKARKVLRD